MFAPSTNNIEVIKKWLEVLSNEVVERWTQFSDTHDATRINFKFGQSTYAQPADVGNKIFPLPIPTTPSRIVSIGAQFAMNLFQLHPHLQMNSVSVTICDIKPKQIQKNCAKQVTLSQLCRKRERDREHDMVIDDDDDCKILRHFTPGSGAKHAIDVDCEENSF